MIQLLLISRHLLKMNTDMIYVSDNSRMCYWFDGYYFCFGK